MAIEEHLYDLRKWRRLHAEHIEKTNIELASIQEAASEAANKLRAHLTELAIACKQLDWLLALFQSLYANTMASTDFLQLEMTRTA